MHDTIKFSLSHRDKIHLLRQHNLDHSITDTMLMDLTWQTHDLDESFSLYYIHLFCNDIFLYINDENENSPNLDNRIGVGKARNNLINKPVNIHAEVIYGEKEIVRNKTQPIKIHYRKSVYAILEPDYQKGSISHIRILDFGKPTEYRYNHDLKHWEISLRKRDKVKIAVNRKKMDDLIEFENKKITDNTYLELNSIFKLLNIDIAKDCQDKLTSHLLASPFFCQHFQIQEKYAKIVGIPPHIPMYIWEHRDLIKSMLHISVYRSVDFIVKKLNKVYPHIEWKSIYIIHVLRFYEECGLIKKIKNKNSKFQLFSYLYKITNQNS